MIDLDGIYGEFYKARSDSLIIHIRDNLEIEISFFYKTVHSFDNKMSPFFMGGKQYKF